MNISNLHPGLIMIGCGFLAMVLPTYVRKLLQLAAPALALYLCFQLTEESTLPYTITQHLQVELIHCDRLAWIFLLIFCIIAVINAIYGFKVMTGIEAGMAMIYAGSVMGITLAGDYLSFIFFWEIAAFSSAYLVYAGHCRRSSRAAFRYLLVHAFGGNMVLAGFMIHIFHYDLGLANMANAFDASFWLILIGVGVNAVLPPLNSWIVDAYPEGSIGGTVYMASYTTKVGIYALIRLFAGTEFLLYVGVFMAIYGACMALIENDMRRLFSYHIVSQLGYMVAALAVAGDYGIAGASAHAFTNILYKGVLFMAAGAVMYATGKRNISEVGGLAKKMPLTAICFLIASLAISGVPYLNGFASKALISHAMTDTGHPVAGLFLTAASVGTWLSIALKGNIFIFFGKTDKDVPCRKVPWSMQLAMVLGTAACVVTGVMPKLLYDITPTQADGHPFTPEHIAEYLCLFAGATLVFWLFRRIMAPHDELSIDFDWFYRKPLKYFVEGLSKALYAFLSWCDRWTLSGVQYLGTHFGNPRLWTQNSSSEAIRSMSFQNEDNLIGDIILAVIGTLAAMFIVVMCVI
ncbi:MAG: hypothetical protein IJH75_08130 [Mogibacterium sp.]|nr:hypothetical protein [Mogibacterium sp.]